MDSQRDSKKDVQQDAVARWISDRIFEHFAIHQEKIKPSVVRLAVRQIALRILGSRLTSWDPIHINTLRAVMATEEGVRDQLGPLIDLAAGQIFHGHVVPLQRVLQVLEESDRACLGRCVCRASGTVSDLRGPDGVTFCADERTLTAHLHHLLEAYNAIREEDTVTAPALLEAFEAMRAAEHRSPRERLAGLFEMTYPYWELLLHHRDFTDRWEASMTANRKTLPIHKRLLEALVLAHYHTRGAIFTGMEVVDSQYCICVCPGPENDKGCSLVHWHYFSRMDHCLFPNESDYFGQRRGDDGAVLPCNRFEARATRPCLGCGCVHSEEEGAE